MEYVYAALILHESDAEINEEHLTAVLDAAGVDVEESRVKALVAALEDVDIEEALETAAAVPAAPATGGGADEADRAQEEADAGEAEAEVEAGDEDEEDEEDEEVSGEGLGDLFG